MVVVVVVIEGKGVYGGVLYMRLGSGEGLVCRAKSEERLVKRNKRWE